MGAYALAITKEGEIALAIDALSVTCAAATDGSKLRGKASPSPGRRSVDQGGDFKALSVGDTADLVAVSQTVVILGGSHSLTIPADLIARAGIGGAIGGAIGLGVAVASLLIATTAKASGAVAGFLTGFTISRSQDADATEADLVGVTAFGKVSHPIGTADRDVGAALALASAGSADRLEDTFASFADFSVPARSGVVAGALRVTGFQSITIGTTDFATATDWTGIRFEISFFVTAVFKVTCAITGITLISADIGGNPYIGLVLCRRFPACTAQKEEEYQEDRGSGQSLDRNWWPERHG